MTRSVERPSRRRFLTGYRDASPRNVRDWQPVDALAPGYNGTLWSIWGSTPDNLLAVGDDGIVLAFDGDAWKQHPAPTRLPLHAVWMHAGGDAFVVGWMGIICRFRDRTWQCQQGGRIDPVSGQYASTVENQPLFGVWGRSDDDVWSVGDHGRIVRYDGERWIEQASGVEQHLRGIVGFDDGSVIACGMQGTLVRFDGKDWCLQEIGTSTNLTRLWARARDDVYAVGGHYDVDANRFVGDVLHFDGNRWRAIAADDPPQRLRGVSGQGSTVLLVGDRGAVYQVEDERITPIESGVGHDLQDLVLFEDTAVAVGDFGTVLCTGTESMDGVKGTNVAPASELPRWESVAQGVTNRILWSVWGPGRGNIFAAGENGTIVHYDGARWTPMPTPTELHLHGIWGTSPRNVYAVGQLGLILHYDGSEWREVHRLSVEVTAIAITGFGPHEIFVVGDEGLILVYDGARWQRTPGGTKDALYGIWGLDARHVLAVGDFGTVLRWNGDRWDEFNAGTERFLYGVWGDSLENIHAVGLSGAAFHFDGGGWTQKPTRQRADLLAIAGGGEHGPFAVGTLGTALAHDGVRWTAEPTDTERSLRALWVDDDGTVFAVGDGGTVLRREVRL